MFTTQNKHRRFNDDDDEERERTGRMMMTMKNVKELEEEELTSLLLWVDDFPLSKEKRNLTRDFSDGVTVSEILKYFIPKVVEVSQFTPSYNTSSKEANWHHLNRKVLGHIGLELHHDVIHALVQCRPWVVENLLLILRDRLSSLGLLPALPQTSHREVPAQRNFQSNVGQVLYGPGKPVYSTNASGMVAQNEGMFPAIGSRPYGNPGHVSPVRSKDFSYGLGGGSPTLKRPQLVERSVDKTEMKEIEVKNKTIESLTREVLRLEHVIRLKDIRIEDLTTRLEEAGLLPPSSISQSQAKEKMTSLHTTSSPRRSLVRKF